MIQFGCKVFIALNRTSTLINFNNYLSFKSVERRILGVNRAERLNSTPLDDPHKSHQHKWGRKFERFKTWVVYG